MKTLNNKLNSFCKALLILVISTNFVFAQTARPKVGVLNIDALIPNADPVLYGNIVRIELAKLDTFEILDKYDVQDAVKKNGLEPANCFGKECLVRIGNLINADYMLTGSVELISNNIIVNLKLIDVKNKAVVKTAVKTFNNLPAEISSMMNITMCNMFGRNYDASLNDRLVKKFDYENPINQPNVTQLNLQGPRMGMTYLFGQDGATLQRAKYDGGFGLNPTMFQIGYQFEKQYLNGGTYQALFEFVPMITGIEQSQFMPSVTVINGLRNNKNGWEIGVGVTVGLTQMADTYQSPHDGKYYLMSNDQSNPRSYLNSYEYIGNTSKPAPVNTTRRFDSGGDNQLMTAVVIAVGKSFRTGTLNVPVNFWIMPQKDAFRVGLSVGFNSIKPE